MKGRRPRSSGPLASPHVGRALVAAAALLLACNPNTVRYTPAPIPVAAGPGGALWAYASLRGEAAPVPFLVDTGTVLTTRAAAKGGGDGSLVETTLTLFDVPQDGSAPVARAEFDDVNVLEAPLGPIARDAATLDLGGVLGGDLLQQFALHLRYGAAGPTVALEPQEAACSCAVADQCDVELPFTLAGGGTLALGDNVYTYPATRVTVDACLEPVTDPIARGVLCGDFADSPPSGEGYDVDGAPGVDARLLVATGFPGIILGASVFDRLCAPSTSTLHHTQLCAGGDAHTLLAAGPTTTIRLPSGETVAGVARSLGDAQAAPALAALALVGREGLLGACGELARSRRLRGHPRNATVDFANAGCGNLQSGLSPDVPTCLHLVDTQNCGSPDRCDDRAQPAAAYLELDEPLPFLLVDDSAPILQEANYDTRPTLSDIEGVVGSELLARLDARIDYPQGRKRGRVIAHCASCGLGCTAYPRYACSGLPSVVGCGSEGQTQDEPSLCNPPSSLVPGGPRCQPAPSRTDVDRDAGLPPACAMGDGGAASDGGSDGAAAIDAATTLDGATPG